MHRFFRFPCSHFSDCWYAFDLAQQLLHDLFCLSFLTVKSATLVLVLQVAHFIHWSAIVIIYYFLFKSIFDIAEDHRGLHPQRISDFGLRSGHVRYFQQGIEVSFRKSMQGQTGCADRETTLASCSFFRLHLQGKNVRRVTGFKFGENRCISEVWSRHFKVNTLVRL